LEGECRNDLRMQILFATSNPHKLEEVRAAMAPIGIEIIGLDALDQSIPEPIEDQPTFAGNAQLKAVYYATHAGCLCLADDSGLEVDALDGEPGVISARYAGVDGSREQRDAANNAKLLDKLSAVPDAQRTARFVCTMCLADADGNVRATSRGTFEGIIGHAPAGSNGFGYDPLLILPDAGCTVAQLDAAAKNARSHRGQASRAMAEQLKAIVTG
jgi:XTP/dITP diphosphohydrolase